MSEEFVSDARIVQKILDPRTGTSHLIDFQYWRQQLRPIQAPSKERPYAEHVADLGRQINTALGLGRVYDPPPSEPVSFLDEDDGA
jgi:hypothetical protein